MSPQCYAFILSIICGFIAAILLGMRNAISANAVIEIFADILWWCTAVAVFVYCMWQSVTFDIRFFQIIGFGFGAISAYFSIGRYISKITRMVFGLIFKILLTPWTFLYKILVVYIFGLIKPELRKVANDESPEK